LIKDVKIISKNFLKYSDKEMKSKTWIKRVYDLMEGSLNFSDYDKMSDEQKQIIGHMKASFFNDLGDYEDEIGETIRKYK
jgi:hypothetical protein